MKGNSVYKALWAQVTDLMGRGSHLGAFCHSTWNVTFLLVSFWFALVTLVTYRHLVLTAQLEWEALPCRLHSHLGARLVFSC